MKMEGHKEKETSGNGRNEEIKRGENRNDRKKPD
jgi:hypothetical protein